MRIWGSLFAIAVTGCSSNPPAPGGTQPPPPCGNGVRAGAEQCDGSDLAGFSCTALGYDGGELTCAADCTFEVAACTGTPPLCGDATIEGLEQCEGTDLGGRDCIALGWDGGALACSGDCTYDTSGCTGAPPQCGDGVAEGLEECDQSDFAGSDCTDFGFVSGALACDDGCRVVTGACVGPSCGDQIRNGSEECEGTDLGGATCRSLNLGTGNLGCTTSCAYDTSACVPPTCGDGAINQSSEQCDDPDFANASCASLGYQGGFLACDTACRYNPAFCFGSTATCGDAVIEGPEQCEGSDHAGQDCVTRGFDGGTLACTTTDCTFDTGGCTGSGPICGDGVREGDEQCETGDLGGRSCQDFGFNGGALTCTQCAYDFSGCTNNPDPVCGNQQAERREVCDGTDLRGQTCTTLQAGTGDLGCSDTCDAFDLSACSAAPVCPNGTAESGELCDTNDVRGATCAMFGAGTGTVVCNAACDGFDLSGCSDAPVCGNDTAESIEACDGTDLRSFSTCSQHGYSGPGPVACLPTCGEFDLSQCGPPNNCGNGRARNREQCDTDDLRGLTCRSLGYASGTLDCLTNCAFDVSGCVQ